MKKTKSNRYKQPDDHNSGQWLEVRFLAARQRGPVTPQPAGWYVVRTCPCHSGMPVTLPQPSKEQAERVRQVILDTNTKPPQT